MSGALPRRDTRWWGWGDPSVETGLDERVVGLIRDEVGRTHPATRPESVEQVELPEARPLPRQLIEAVEEENVFTGVEDRVRHAHGSSYSELLALRSGRLEHAPDAVLVPQDPDALGAVLELCAEHGVAVVPFGGGTSVVGGVLPLRGGHDTVISLDTVALRRVEVDPRSLTATLGAGLRGPEAEAALGARGFTIGHFPQSFEYATVGGFAATRSSGQSSSGYGRFDSLVSSVRLATPVGDMATLETPHTAAGPALRELIVGSEGMLGVIPEVTVRIRPAPEVKRYEAWMVEDFSAGCEIVRSLAQSDLLPTVIRVSDETETRISLAMSGPRGTARTALERYLRLRGVSGGCLMIVGYEGTPDFARRRRSLAVHHLRRGGAVPLGQSAGGSWAKGRFHGPYLRDGLMDIGVTVETLETAQQWSRHPALYELVGGAIRAELSRQSMSGVVFCHLSHAYRDGASLYFTVIASGSEPPSAEAWMAVKRAASQGIGAAGGTITHHHATGTDHAPYLEREVGRLGIEALRGVKERLDPAGIMNPGKLLG